MKGIILKDDARYCFTENYLKNKGCVFLSTDAMAQDLDFLIFGFRGEVDEYFYDEKYFEALRDDVLIFSGIRSPYLEKMSKNHGLKYFIMTENTDVAIKNAVPTSEGVISYLITNRIDTIADSRILIIGYGICGKDLSKRLTALGANVQTLVRNEKREKEAVADSIIPIYLDELFDYKFNVIINTVPQQILTNEMIEKTNGALLIDIASKPFGFDIDYAIKFNAKSASLQGIPGKYAVRTAGEILGEYIEVILRSVNTRR
jgi:dipicolinate synthase subunit A